MGEQENRKGLSMTARELVKELFRQGYELHCRPGGVLEVYPEDGLTSEMQEGIHRHKAEIIAWISRPRINSRGRLIVPITSDCRYHWWNGGQSIWETIRELKAHPEVFARYVEADYSKAH